MKPIIIYYNDQKVMTPINEVPKQQTFLFNNHLYMMCDHFLYDHVFNLFTGKIEHLAMDTQVEVVQVKITINPDEA
jgi:hypothetical protein